MKKALPYAFVSEYTYDNFNIIKNIGVIPIPYQFNRREFNKIKKYFLNFNFLKLISENLILKIKKFIDNFHK